MWSYLLLWPLLDKGSDKSSSFLSCWNCLAANLAHLFFNRTGFRRNAQKIAKAYSIIHAFTSLFSTGLNRKRNSAHSQTEVIHQCLFVFTVMYKLFTIALWLVHKKQSCFCCLVCLFIFYCFPQIPLSEKYSTVYTCEDSTYESLGSASRDQDQTYSTLTYKI